MGGDQLQIAFHEAGHAVMCFLMDMDIFEISILSKGNTQGYVSHSMDSYFQIYKKAIAGHFHFESFSLEKYEARITMEKIIMIFLSGFIAEKILLEKEMLKNPQEDLERGAAEDMHFCIQIAERFICLPSFMGNPEENEAGLYLDWLVVRTQKILAMDENWKAVQALSGVISLKKKLSGEEAKEVIRNALEKT